MKEPIKHPFTDDPIPPPITPARYFLTVQVIGDVEGIMRVIKAIPGVVAVDEPF